VINYEPLFQALRETKADLWVSRLPQQINAAFDPAKHGNLAGWQQLIDNLPEFLASARILDADTVTIGSNND